jgi:hypothetical protein
MEKIDQHENAISDIKNTIKHSQDMLQDIQQSCLSTNSLIATKDFEQTQKPQLRECLTECKLKLSELKIETNIILVSSIKKSLQSYTKNTDDKFNIRDNEVWVFIQILFVER